MDREEETPTKFVVSVEECGKICTYFGRIGHTAMTLLQKAWFFTTL